jgi:hypothetical protein
MTAGIAASGARVAYYYVLEAADGTIAANPQFKPIRLTQNGVQEQSSEIQSNEISADRHRKAARRGATSLSGDIVGELSYGTFDDLLQAAFCGTWAGDVLKTGTVRRSFAILKRNLDIGIDTIYRGVQINQLKFACPLQEKITVTFSVVGKAEEAYVVPNGATFAQPTTTDYMTTFEGSLDLDDAEFNAATDLNITLGNNIEAKYSLFNRPAYGMKIGMIDVTGDLSAYIEDAVLKNKYRNEVDTEMQVTVTDKATNGNAYRLTLPRERFTSAQDSYNGDDLGVQQLNFRALYDATTTTELMLERVPYVAPANQ